MQIRGGGNKNLPHSGVYKHREAAGSAKQRRVLLPSAEQESELPQRRGRRAVANAPVLLEHRVSRHPLCHGPGKCFQLPSPESRRARYTCNYQAKRLRARRTAELVLLPTQHKEALTSTQQPTCAGEGNNYIFILSFRHLLTFLHTAAEGRARTDGSHSKDRHGGRRRAWSKHLLTASLLDTVLTGRPPASPGEGGGHSASHPLCTTRGETTQPGLGDIQGRPSILLHL